MCYVLPHPRGAPGGGPGGGAGGGTGRHGGGAYWPAPGGGGAPRPGIASAPPPALGAGSAGRAADADALSEKAPYAERSVSRGSSPCRLRHQNLVVLSLLPLRARARERGQRAQ
jgi:hypothetical protein